MLVPSFLKPSVFTSSSPLPAFILTTRSRFVASIYSRLRATTNEMLVHFAPIFKERRARMEGRGHWEDGAELPVRGHTAPSFSHPVQGSHCHPGERRTT